jgi:hypothetical protein
MTAAEKIAPTIDPTVSQLTGFAQLYRALARIFKHPWDIQVSHFMDGLPSYIIKVNTPSTDAFMYDERVSEVIAENTPPGYVDDGTCHGDRGDGSTAREYHLYPEKKS